MPKSTKLRLDKLLVELGLAASRERAQALILAGKVLCNEQKIEKPGATVAANVPIRLLGEDLKYVSRGGLKLERALDHWQLDLNGRVCMDVGASTGGFTDCMLQRGAGLVVAVDTGYGQIDTRLRSDARVKLLERTNARYLSAAMVGSLRPSFAAIDVSFISATLVLPPVKAVCVANEQGRCELAVLVKPQFEVGRKSVGKGGIVRDPQAQAGAVERVKRTANDLQAKVVDVIESPILGAEGNREFLLYALF
ncbi:MAG: TlyA family RNA methyltransferase [Acidobacteriales bacterium]|nr:TlyA family RNA methyltransferase [Terriglobales bacterium]